MSLVNVELNINALMSIAVTGAFLIGQWPVARGGYGDGFI
jgi:cation transport ATPase